MSLAMQDLHGSPVKARDLPYSASALDLHLYLVVMHRPITLVFRLVFLALLAGCGGNESRQPVEIDPTTRQSKPTSSVLWPLDPLWFSYQESEEVEGQIIPRDFQLDPSGFEAMEQSELNPSGSQVETVITGMDISAVDSRGDPLKVEAGLLARRYDPETRLLSEETRMFFSETGVDSSKGQKIDLTSYPRKNVALGGLGLRMANGKISFFELERKPLSEIGSSSNHSLDGFGLGDVSVRLDPGYVAIGVFIRMKRLPRDPDDDRPALTGTLFLNDVFFDVLLIDPNL